jgi:apolipoprotein N-acyltransferase
LLAAAAPPSPLPLLALVALAPFLAALSRLSAGVRGRSAALRAGALCAAVYWGVTLLWVPQAGLRVGAWVVPGYLGIVATLALLGAAAAALFHRLVVDRRLSLVLAAALGWGAVEWIRTAWLGPFSFPWMGLALPLTAHPTLIQGAAWVGEIGVAVGVAAANGAVAAALLDEPRGRWRRLAVVAAVVAGVAVLGQIRIRTTPLEPVVRVLVVQPNVPLAVKRAGGDESLRASLAAIETALAASPDAVPEALPQGRSVDLVVLPETALPVVLDGVAAAEVRARVAGWARRFDAPVLVGAWAKGSGRGGNAVFLASGDPAEVWPAAWKVRLVPGVEWTPGFADGVQAGSAPQVLTMPDGRSFGALICIESAGPDPARALVRGGAEFVVNVTNDAWLAESEWWTRSTAFAQHPAHLSFRAVELGVGVVRAANNGWSGVVDPFGRRTALLAPHVAGSAVADVARLSAATPFVAGGPWVGPLVVGVALALSFVGRVHRPEGRGR